MSVYKLPIGIRLLKEDEFPTNFEYNKDITKANIIEGYRINLVNNHKYTHFLEINVDVDKLWILFEELSRTLIDKQAFGIVGMFDENPLISKQKDKNLILSIFSKYKFELCNDGFLLFGITNVHETNYNEIFVNNYKYIQVWTSNFNLVKKVLDKYNIKEIRNINFIDEFPVASEALIKDSLPNVRSYFDVLDGVVNELGII